MNNVKIKYFDDSIEPLGFIDKGCWIDLRCREDIKTVAGAYIPIPLNVAIELPEGYEAIVAARSSTFKNHGIFMPGGIGVIDTSYCGDSDEWKMPVVCTRDGYISKGTRIAQFRIQECMNKSEFNFETVDHLNNKNRGGLGSTGKDEVIHAEFNQF